MWLLFAPALALALSSASAMGAEPVRIHAAGSLKAALTELVESFTARYGIPVETTFAASGLLRQRIEGGEASDLFASANMKHPLALAAAGRGGPVVLFARNRLCALAAPDLEVSPHSLLDMMLDPEIRLGTSTPKADPSGDYAWELFRRAEQVRAGSYAKLNRKALKLTGGPDSPKPPDGRNTYAWVMDSDQADLFLTYCTNAVLASSEVPGLQVLQVPKELSVGADYGLNLLDPANPAAVRLALSILSPEGQRVLRDHGFATVALPAGS